MTFIKQCKNDLLPKHVIGIIIVVSAVAREGAGTQPPGQNSWVLSHTHTHTHLSLTWQFAST